MWKTKISEYANFGMPLRDLNEGPYFREDSSFYRRYYFLKELADESIRIWNTRP